jgi:hypothetical protein
MADRQQADFESKTTYWPDIYSFHEAFLYFTVDNYECMHAQDWNLLKFYAQKDSLLTCIGSAKIINSGQLRDILVLIARLINKTDHNLPRTFLIHALAEGPIELTALRKSLSLFCMAETKKNNLHLRPVVLAQIDVFYYSM